MPEGVKVIAKYPHLTHKDMALVSRGLRRGLRLRHGVALLQKLWQPSALHATNHRRTAMPSTLDTLQAEVLRLSAGDRAKLLDRLIASLDSDPELEAAWDAVAQHREADLDTGSVAPVPLVDAITRLEARFPG